MFGWNTVRNWIKTKPTQQQKYRQSNEWMNLLQTERFAKYGGRNTVTALTGDGVGPDLIQIVEEVFR